MDRTFLHRDSSGSKILLSQLFSIIFLIKNEAAFILSAKILPSLIAASFAGACRKGALTRALLIDAISS